MIIKQNFQYAMIYSYALHIEPNLKQVVNKEKYKQKHLKRGKENRETKSSLGISPLYFD